MFSLMVLRTFVVCLSRDNGDLDSLPLRFLSGSNVHLVGWLVNYSAQLLKRLKRIVWFSLMIFVCVAWVSRYWCIGPSKTIGQHIWNWLRGRTLLWEDLHGSTPLIPSLHHFLVLDAFSLIQVWVFIHNLREVSISIILLRHQFAEL